MHKSTYEAAKELARRLRRRETPAEATLWKSLRNRQLLGKKFLRQHPLFFSSGSREAFFVADFYCREARLVIEIDGANHEYQQEYDKFRTHVINNLGTRVVRFRNDEIENDLDQVLERLKEVVLSAGSTPHSPSLSI